MTRNRAIATIGPAGRRGGRHRSIWKTPAASSASTGFRGLRKVRASNGSHQARALGTLAGLLPSAGLGRKLRMARHLRHRLVQRPGRGHDDDPDDPACPRAPRAAHPLRLLDGRIPGHRRLTAQDPLTNQQLPAGGKPRAARRFAQNVPVMRAAILGVPMPVAWSYPGAAGYRPLSPAVMSWTGSFRSRPARRSDCFETSSFLRFGTSLPWQKCPP